ncbi:MAG: hypothetical protein QM756_35250 [Polyangiaceae bacterium]
MQVAMDEARPSASTACWAAWPEWAAWPDWLQGEHANSAERCRKSANVGRIASSDHGGFELESGSNNEGIDGVSGRQLCSGQQVTRLLSDSTVEIEDADARIVEQVVDGGVETGASTHLGEDGRRHADQGSSLEGEAQDGRRAGSQDPSLTWLGERVEGLGVEN